MRILFLYNEDCPSHEVALSRLQQVMREEGAYVPIEVVQVETDQQAQQLRFCGSPTILINGQDIDPADWQQDSAYGLGCRAYQLEDGRISPLPSVAMLRMALRAAMGKNID
jgi:hypothetical protein